jgi:hypothetical protein
VLRSTRPPHASSPRSDCRSGRAVSALLSDSRGRSGHRTDGESGNRRPAPVRQIEDRWCASCPDGETHLEPATPSISRATSPNADGEVRTVLYEAASMPVRSKQRCSAKELGGRIAAKRGHKRAVVAVRASSRCIVCGWTAASSVLRRPMDMKMAQEQVRRRRSPPRVEGSGERRLADGFMAENGFGFRRAAERRVVDRSGCGEHDILPPPTPLWRLRARGNAGVAPRSRHRHVRPHGTRG